MGASRDSGNDIRGLTMRQFQTVLLEKVPPQMCSYVHHGYILHLSTMCNFINQIFAKVLLKTENMMFDFFFFFA